LGAPSRLLGYVRYVAQNIEWYGSLSSGGKKIFF